MLQIINGPFIAQDNYYIQHSKDGMDELHFEINVNDPVYKIIQEEDRIIETTEQQTYVVRTINAGNANAKIICQIDLDDWKGTCYIGTRDAGTGKLTGFRTENTAGAIMQQIVPSGWSIVNLTPKQAVRLVEMFAPTPLEIAQQVMEAFSCSIRFHTRTKQAEILYPSDMPVSNSYAIDTVNLRSVPQYRGRSTGMYTRIYPIGKDDITITQVNPTHHPYIDAADPFTDRIICKIYRDAQQDDPTALMADAQQLVNAAATPERSWTLDVVDLNRIDSEKWQGMDLSLFTKLLLQDRLKGFRSYVQVVEDRVYPNFPESNSITVATVSGSVQRTLKYVYDQITNPNSTFYQQLEARR